MTTLREIERLTEPGNRQQRRARRARITRFSRRQSGILDTALLSIGEINRHPRHQLFFRAAAFWRERSCPSCFVCGEPLPFPAAFLFATAGATPTQAAVSGMCANCWRHGDEVEIDDAATRVLHEVAPGGHFLDPRAVLP
ncbi:hypothetical protein [Bradyrhizobium sp. HKCCYLRH3061]|uniref:hypothetical protein n=1 Tax=Bradyrhizobium sp. HKCCYLRH3061 TaxID=3420734 RepID=UPI003EBA89D0